MIKRTLPAVARGVIFFLIAMTPISGGTDLVTAAPPTPTDGRGAVQPRPPGGQPDKPVKPKSRRVVILGTTIAGEVLTPPIEKTVPWQDPAAFRLDPAPLKHDFMEDLLTPVDRERILRETDPDH